MLRRHIWWLAPLAGAAVAGAIVAAVSLGGGSSPKSPPKTSHAGLKPAAAALAFQRAITAVVHELSPSVVQIQTPSGLGSGIVFDSKGDIVTNAHVVDGATAITVHFQSGKSAKATLVGSDDSTDIAVIKVDVSDSLLHPLAFGSSDAVQVGQEVAAIGSPFGLPESMTAGIVSALNRTITAPNNFSISGAIQTDAAINHGNSGGPLLDMNGRVIGVNAQIESDSGGNDGVGFAIGSNAAKNVADTLISGGKVQHAYLGIRVNDASGNGGAEVVSVVSGSPADKGGMKAGDVVTAIAGTEITSGDDLTAAVAAHKPSDVVNVTVTRNGKSETLKITLGVRPS